MAGSVASQVILFVAMIGITTGLVVVFSNYVDETSSSTTTQWKMMSNQMKTDVTITSITYTADSPDNTTVFVLNTGKTKLNITGIDVYLDGFINRNDASREMMVVPSTDTIDTDIWNPKEVLEIEVYKDLSASTTYEICITTEYGTRTCDTFST